MYKRSSAGCQVGCQPAGLDRTSIAGIKHEEPSHGVDISGCGILVHGADAQRFSRFDAIPFGLRVNLHWSGGRGCLARSFPYRFPPRDVIKLHRDAMWMQVRAEKMNGGIEGQLEGNQPL